VGEICHIYPRGARRISAEVIGFRNDRFMMMPYGETHGLTAGSPVFSGGRAFTVHCGDSLLGRVLDGFGRPIDGKGPLAHLVDRPLAAAPPNPMKRQRITDVLPTGIRVVDGLLTIGRGQRIGIFAGSGVGKSTLLGMIARNAQADINVIALIGERGREVQEFLQADLQEDGLARSVVIVSTSDQPALVRMKAAWVATAIAEFFRDQGLNVMFMMDSVTRFAMAQREIGLAAGEPPATRGYTPSVFAVLPRLLERTGTGETGAITSFYTVLMEGDDLTEPVTDTVRGILDGHLFLSRDLANENHYPAIDVMGSVSRVMAQITKPEHRRLVGRFKSLLATYRANRDLINVGAYAAGSNPEIDRALRLLPSMNDYLRQQPEERSSFSDALQRLEAIVEEAV
jgi:flagellum-specific ATP synthase